MDKNDFRYLQSQAFVMVSDSTTCHCWMGYALHYGIGFNWVHSIYSIGFNPSTLWYRCSTSTMVLVSTGSYVDMVLALTNLHCHIWVPIDAAIVLRLSTTSSSMYRPCMVLVSTRYGSKFMQVRFSTSISCSLAAATFVIQSIHHSFAAHCAIHHTSSTAITFLFDIITFF